MVNVTRKNFIEQSNDLLEHLPTASFVAIDEEMTGISFPGTGRPRKDQSPNEKYSDLKKVPERYSIIQLGVSLFHPCNPNRNSGSATGPRWKVRSYNFYMFPGTSPDEQGNNNHGDPLVREVVLNPSAVAFLHGHNMSFDLWTKEGVPYATGDQAADALQNYVFRERKERDEHEAERQGKAPTVEETLRRRVELRRSDDIDFSARTMASLREWLDSAHEAPAAAGVGAGGEAPPLLNGANSFLLPPCNSFLRRALYENIGKEYPYLILEKSDLPNQIRVLRLNEAEKVARWERMRCRAWENVVLKVGMWRVVAALRLACNGTEIDRNSALFAKSADQVDLDSMQGIFLNGPQQQGPGRKIPLVVHNGFMDVLFLLTHFHSHELPDTLPECKQLIASYFPVVYDTKVMATECSVLWSNEQTYLSNLYTKVVRENAAVHGAIEIARNGEEEDGEIAEENTVDVGQEHEAAYDAFMTGCVFVGLSDHIKGLHRYFDDVDGLPHLITAQQGRGDDEDGNNNNAASAASSVAIRFSFGRNKLYQMSMFTLDLEEQFDDPLQRGMSSESAYRVSGIDPSVATRDIVRSMADLTDDEGRRVNFDIVWVDDTTFIVAVRYRPSENEAPGGNAAAANNNNDAAGLLLLDETSLILRKHGQLVFQALRNRFQKEEIVSLVEYLRAQRQTGVEEETPSWLSRLLKLVGFNKRKADSEDAKPAAKRRRQS